MSRFTSTLLVSLELSYLENASLKNLTLFFLIGSWNGTVPSLIRFLTLRMGLSNFQPEHARSFAYLSRT